MKDPASNPSKPPATAPQIRIVLVDDHAIVRHGLRMFIELQPDLAVIGEGADGLEAIALAAQLQPDVVLLDLAMPQMGGVEATREILECSPHSRILILTSFGEDDQVFPAIQAGAHGYLLKDIQPLDLIQAIRATYHGHTQLHPRIARRLMSAVAESPPKQPPKPTPNSPELDGLTERERDVLGLIAQGLSNREISEKIVISESTVKTHVSNVLNKLDLEDRTQAAIWALKHGFGDA